MIVVPVDEAVAFTASVLEQLLRTIDDRLARAENAAGGVFNEPRLFRSGVDLPLDHPTCPWR